MDQSGYIEDEDEECTWLGFYAVAAVRFALVLPSPLLVEVLREPLPPATAARHFPILLLVADSIESNTAIGGGGESKEEEVVVVQEEEEHAIFQCSFS
jgi:hypothetical protein